ncbi:MAG: sarcosine oxidase subunit gamma [Halocynthiibacter sp.]|jgi:sarcosine oxidase subunit gamma
MHDPVMALNGARFEGFVTISEQPVRGMISLRADLTNSKIAKLVKKQTGCEMPEQGGAEFGEEAAVFWMSPDEALILCDYSDAPRRALALREELGDIHSLITVVSDARTSFRIEGAQWRDVLAKLTPADIAPDHFAPGMLRRSRIAQTAAAFWTEEEESAELICFRSVAQYVFELLKTSAKPGSELNVF